MEKCPKCNVEYVEIETDFEYGDVLLRNVKATKCPNCGEELFSLDQYRTIKDRLQSIVQPLRLKRKISAAGKRPIIYLPEDVIKAVKAKPGDEIDIYVEGNKIIIEKTT